MLTALGQIELVARSLGRTNQRIIGRQRRTIPNPFCQSCDLLIFKLAAGRHFQVVVRIADSLNEQAAVWVAIRNRAAAIATAANATCAVQGKATLLLFFTVALVAVLGQQRANLLFKKLKTGNVGRL